MSKAFCIVTDPCGRGSSDFCLIAALNHSVCPIIRETPRAKITLNTTETKLPPSASCRSIIEPFIQRVCNHVANTVSMTKFAKNEFPPSFSCFLDWTDTRAFLSLASTKQHRRKLAWSPAHIALENTHTFLVTRRRFALHILSGEHLGGVPPNQ